MFDVKIAVISNDEQLLEAVERELGKYYIESFVEPSRYNEANLAIVDYREDIGREPKLDIPFIAILPRGGFLERRAKGALDVVLYPFMPGDLAFRVLLAVEKPTLEAQADHLWVDLENYEVIADGKPLALTFKEFELLRRLIKSKGRVVPRNQLLNEVWGRDYINGNRTIDVHIRRLRAKLGNKYGDLVQTVRGVGYRFRASAEVLIEDEGGIGARSDASKRGGGGAQSGASSQGN